MNTMKLIKEFAETMGQERGTKEMSFLYLKLIEEEYGEFLEEIYPEEELKELADLVYVVYGYAYHKGWDLDEAIKRVHRNNIGRCIQPDGTIKRNAQGKVLKNPAYPKPNLKDLL